MTALSVTLRAALVMTAALCACASPAANDSVTATVRDSAGVHLVDFARLPTGTGPVQLASRPSITLGGIHDNDSLEFDARAAYLSAVQLADGQIVVGDHHRLKYYDERGQLVRIAGRYGLGPGEFVGIRELCAQTDSTLLVIDDAGNWSVWDRDGRLRHTQPRVGFVPYSGCAAEGRILAREPGMDATLSVKTRRVLPYAVYGIDGTLRQSVGSLAASEYFGQIFFEPSFALTQGELLIADPHAFEVRLQSLATGLTTTRWRVENALRELTDATWDSLNASTAPRNLTAAQRQQRIARLDALGKPATYPAFWKVMLDAQRRIWINPYFDHQRWFVIDSGGARLSMLRLPLAESARAQIAGFAGDRVVVRRVDADGAPQLSIFAIETR
ncbi:MAG: hypothetical protein KA154_21165 [Gemmatimonadaceae bacterium]|nr:hypothetical protein [Gemmatimonadaceae bacterium]